MVVCPVWGQMFATSAPEGGQAGTGVVVVLQLSDVCVGVHGGAGFLQLQVGLLVILGGS